MYKIYIKKSLLILAPKSSVRKVKSKNPSAIIINYEDGQKQIVDVVEQLENARKKNTYVVVSNEYPKLKRKFKKLYITVDAAGGLVINENGQGLFIYKRGKWDLPKGKVEPHETLEQAAIREVEEETSVRELQIVRHLCRTKHTYRTKSGKRAIKRSHWYLMKAPNQKVLPQIEEDIEDVRWINPEFFETETSKLYTNLVKVLLSFQKS